MKPFITITASLATIIAICFASYDYGNAAPNDTPQAIEVTIHNAMSALPQSEQSSAEKLLAPILDKVDSNNSKVPSNNKFEKYGSQRKEHVEKYSLASYQAGKSPFVPPKQKTQYFCNNNFRFSYKGMRNGIETILFLLEGKNHYIEIGQPITFRSEEKLLEIVYLSYEKSLKGPILQYACRDK